MFTRAMKVREMPETLKLNQAGRLFDLALLIAQHPRQYTAPMLSERFQCSLRTVRRDIRTLEDMGIRVESEPSGGYFIMRDLSRMPTALTESERLALDIVPMLPQGALSGGHILPLVSTYRTATEKVLPNAGGTRSMAESNIVVDLGASHDNQDDTAVLEVLYGIQNARGLEILYQKVNGEETEIRQIDPYYLVPWQNSLYVIGYCHLRQAFRTFKVARMQTVRCLPDSFERDATFSLLSFMQSAWGIDQSGEELDVILVFSEDVSGYAAEDIQSHTVIREARRADGRYEVAVRVRFNPEFVRFVLQYGSQVEVQSPERIRAQLREESARMMQQYINAP